MKRFDKILHALLASFLLVSLATMAFAAIRTPTPIVGPTETGEWDAMQQQVVDIARFKPGNAAATCAISGAACSITVNAASGTIAVTTATAGASGTAPSVMTIADSKLQVGDGVLCGVDQNGATAGAVITCLPHITGAGTMTITLSDASVTALTSSSLTVWFLIMTQGNPN